MRSYDDGLVAQGKARATPFPRPATVPRTRWEDHTSSPHRLSPLSYTSYDGDGLRRQKVTAAGTTKFIWDGQDVLLETDVSNNTQVTYTQTPDIYGNLVSQRRSTTSKYYHFDALGSTLALTGSDETVTDTYKPGLPV